MHSFVHRVKHWTSRDLFRQSDTQTKPQYTTDTNKLTWSTAILSPLHQFSANQMTSAYHRYAKWPILLPQRSVLIALTLCQVFVSRNCCDNIETTIFDILLNRYEGVTKWTLWNWPCVDHIINVYSVQPLLLLHLKYLTYKHCMHSEGWSLWNSETNCILCRNIFNLQNLFLSQTVKITKNKYVKAWL